MSADTTTGAVMPVRKAPPEVRGEVFWCCSGSKLALSATASVLELARVETVQFTSIFDLLEKLEETEAPPFATVFLGNEIANTLAKSEKEVGAGCRALLCCDQATFARNFPVPPATISHVAPTDLVGKLLVMIAVDPNALPDAAENAPPVPESGQLQGKHADANDAARWLLACESALVKWQPPTKLVEVKADERIPLPNDTPVLRSRLWHFWKNLLRRRCHDPGLDAVARRAGQKLAIWEDRWGRASGHAARLTKLMAKMDSGNFEEAARLADETYSRTGRDPEHRQQPERRAKPDRMTANRFSILVVEDNKSDLETALSTLQRLCDECEEFAVELILADPEAAYSDALIRLQQVPSIKAVIADWDLGSNQPRAVRGGGTGADLINVINQEWPGVYTCLLTGRGVIEITARNPQLTSRPFSKQDPQAFVDIFADICEMIRGRRLTPLFSALKAYSNRPISIFHALATSRGKVLNKSRWIGEFLEFYGDRVFLAETSTTLAPLDSLLDPKGSIHEAQERAAHVFGADQTFFVTNGTSTANKIVHQALLGPGDVVLLDRTCHKSHHYGLALVGARPVYLKADPLLFNGEFTGIFKGVAVDEIVDKLRKFPAAKMLCLTNCTFDGYTHDVQKIVESVRTELVALRSRTDATDPDEFIFLFDEAWFAFARFLPDLRPYTALFACRRPDLDSARIYVTQSTHKTLVAFRQASMIHVRDPKFARHKHAFNEAIYTHSTTSPSYNLLASLDVGRMHADFEGHQFCSEAWGYSDAFREWHANIGRDGSGGDELIVRYFHVLTPEEMGAYVPRAHNGRLPETGGSAKGKRPEFALDQSKVTIFLRQEAGITGGEFQKYMLNKTDTQFNKTTTNTALLMINLGAAESSIGHLMIALRTLAGQLQKSSPLARKKSTVLFDSEPEFYGNELVLRDFFCGYLKPRAKIAPSQIEFTEALAKLESGSVIVSATFVIPYPPGFPILVPGQIVTKEDVKYLMELGDSEIHGILEKGRLLAWQPEGQLDQPGDRTLTPQGTGARVRRSLGQQ